MSVTTAVEAMAYPIGFDISQSSDIVQAELFTGLAEGFRQIGSIDRDRQFSYLHHRLDVRTRQFLVELGKTMEEPE